MKKLLSLLTCMLLICNFGVTAKAMEGNSDNKSISIKLAPYQKIIDKINKEYGASISIPNDNKVEVYQNIINKPLDEFDKELRKDYEEIKDSESNTYITVNKKLKSIKNNLEGEKVIVKMDKPEKSEDSPITLMSIREETTQKVLLDYGSVFLDSVVFSPTGRSGTYTYDSIKNAGYYKSTDIHFRATSYKCTLSNGDKDCTVVYKGTLYNGSGINLLTTKKYTVSYNAG